MSQEEPVSPQRSDAPSPPPVTPPSSPTVTSPTPSSAGQYIVHRQKMPYQELDVYDVKNIYRTEKDIQRAIAKGRFTHSKLMQMDWNTKNVFFLCYDK